MPGMSSAQIKLFIACITQANYYEESPDGKGERSRRCPLENKQLAEICGWTNRHLIRIKYELIDKGYLKIQKGELIVMNFGEKTEDEDVPKMSPLDGENIPKMSPPKKPKHTKNVTISDKDVPKMSPPSASKHAGPKAKRDHKNLKTKELKSKTENTSPTSKNPPPGSVDSINSKARCKNRKDLARSVLAAMDEHKRKRKKEEAEDEQNNTPN